MDFQDKFDEMDDLIAETEQEGGLGMLNPRQKRFAEEYLKSGNAKEAAIKAGYSAKYAGENADKLLKNTNIQAYMDGLNREIDRQNVADLEEVKTFWTRTMRDERRSLKDRIKASELLAKTEGAFIDRVQMGIGPVDKEAMQEIDALFEDMADKQKKESE